MKKHIILVLALLSSSLVISNASIAAKKKESELSKIISELISEVVSKPIGKSMVLALLPPKDAESVLKKVVLLVNKQSPSQYLDENTLYENASAGPGIRVNYNYRLPNHRLDQLNVVEAKTILEAGTKNNFCSNIEGLAALLDQGVILHYIYRTSDNKQVINLPLDRGSC